jgi:hypothetical protein
LLIDRIESSGADEGIVEDVVIVGALSSVDTPNGRDAESGERRDGARIAASPIRAPVFFFEPTSRQ